MNILITGASSGIGKQLALDYQKLGHSVWGQGRNQQRLQELAEQGITPLQVELGELEQVRSSFADPSWDSAQFSL